MIYNTVSDEVDLSSRYACEVLKENGVDFASGVPCGVLRHFISYFEADAQMQLLPAQNEPEAVGIAAGAYLGGKTPLLYMQNSGMLKATNEFGSLLIPYKIPVVSVVTFRGCEGEDAPQHFTTGGITVSLLDALGIYHSELEEDLIRETIGDVMDWSRSNSMPSVLLIKRGWSSKKEESDSKEHEQDELESQPTQTKDYRNGKSSMKREDALDVIARSTGADTAVFGTTGLISRSLYERHDSPNFFYNTGGFGLVSSIGLGFANAQPSTRVIIVDGDASLLTNLNTLVTIGCNKPSNLVHVVLDNKAYASCSEEGSCSRQVDLSSFAEVAGYKSIFRVDDTQCLARAMTEGSGPKFVHAEIGLGGRRDFARPKDLAHIARRFKGHFSNQ